MTWAYMLGGLVIWTIHFLTIYVFASLAAQFGAETAWRATGVAFSLLCLAAAAALAVIGLRELSRSQAPNSSRLHHAVAAGCGVIGAVGVVFQALPSILG